MQTWGRLKNRSCQLWRRSWRAMAGGVRAFVTDAAHRAAATPPVSVGLAPLPWMAYAEQVRFGMENALRQDEVFMQRLQRWETQSIRLRIWVDRKGRLSALELDAAADTLIEQEFRKRLVGIVLDEPPPPSLRWPIILGLDWSEARAQPDSCSSIVGP